MHNLAKTAPYSNHPPKTPPNVLGTILIALNGNPNLCVCLCFDMSKLNSILA